MHRAELNVNVCSITSFPKSGNTWMRSILAHMFRCHPISKYFPDVYTDPILENAIDTARGQFFFVKSHSSTYEMLQTRVPKTINHHIVLLRHPLDVFCSQLNYVSENVIGANTKFDIPCDSVDAIADRKHIRHFLETFMVYGTLQPWFLEAGSWFRSAEHWVQRAYEKKDVTLIRYEDLAQHPEVAMNTIACLFGVTPEMATQAVEKSQSSTKLDGRFYWKKSIGTFKQYLSEDDQAAFWDLHHARCASLGYFPDSLQHSVPLNV